MKKVLILGASGMAGHMISMYFKTLNRKYRVYDVCRTLKLDESSIINDVHDLKSLDLIIHKVSPDIIINSIGILNKKAEDNPSDTIFINSYFPRYMERKLENTNIKLIHLSTDCVFSGDAGNYSENSITDGRDLYARTKMLGEISNSKDLTVRTSIIGPELKNNGTGLFHWFMNQKGAVKGYSKVIWSGVTTLQLAKALDTMIEEDLKGLYNLTSKTPINKYDLLQMIKSEFYKEISIEDYKEVSNDKSLVSYRIDFEVEIPSYKNMIKELKQWMIENKKLYLQYF